MLVENIPTGSDGEEEPVTCAICEDADRMIAATVEPIVAVIAAVRSELQRLQKSVSALKLAAIADHPQCPKCGLFFGGTHYGGLLPVPEESPGVCKWCVRKSQNGTTADELDGFDSLT